MTNNNDPQEWFNSVDHIIAVANHYVQVIEVTARYLDGKMSAELAMHEIKEIVTRKGE